MRLKKKHDHFTILTSRIRGFVRGQERNSATAFSWRENNRRFMVTNKHVILGDDFIRNPQPLTSVRLCCHQASNLAENRDVDVQLFSGTAPVWFEHQNPEVDIVLIPVQDEIFNNFAFPAFERSNLPPSNLIIGPGEPLAVVGYPLGFYDSRNNLPIVRSASLASAYPVPFNGLPLFVTDARLHHGTSGAPVLFLTRGSYRTPGALNVGDLPPILLGIHSGTWPTRLSEEPLNLNATWFSSSGKDLRLCDNKGRPDSAPWHYHIPNHPTSKRRSACHCRSYR